MISFPVFSQEMVNENMKRAQECFARVDASNSFKDNLNQVDMNILPMAINQSIHNMDVTLAVNSAEFFPDHTVLEVFLRLEIPNREKPLMFGAKGIKLSHDGDIIGDARLSLLSNIDIPMRGNNILLRIKGNYDNKTGQSDDLSYVSIDCKGLKQLGLAAEIEFSDKLCVPVDANGKVIPNRKVTGEFQTEIDNWSDILARVSLPSFEIKGLKGFIWNIEDAIFDFSDLKNDQLLVFPPEYREYLIPGNEVLWNGVYIKKLSVTLPPQFSTSDKKRAGFLAEGMIIDENGITGVFSANNLIAYDQGDAGGWAFSVDSFSLNLLANHLEKAQFSGMIGLPVSQNSRLSYDGLISDDDTYILKVGKVDTLSFDLFHAKAELDPNSYIEFKVVEDQFRPEAMLHGRMGIYVEKDAPPNNSTGSTGNKKSLMAFEGVEFRSLHLQTRAPFLSVEYFGYKGDAQLANFPISIKEIALRATNREAVLGIDLDVTLMDGTFKGGTRVEIVGVMEEGRLHKWKYDRFNLNRINIEATIGEIMTLKAGLTLMNDDPVYGDGFGGDIHLKFTEKGPVGGLEAEMRGMFGRKDFRYWFIDGIANLPTVGIPIGPGINLTGFGGGVSYRMKPDGLKNGSSGQILTATAMTYVPDESYALGVKASVVFAIPKKEVAQGEACFELAFNNKGGLNYAGFYGYAQFTAAIPGLDNIESVIGDKYKKLIEKEKEIASKLPGQVIKALESAKQYNPGEAGELYADQDKIGKANFTAAIGIQFNFAQSSFDANFNLYVNAAGGVIRGSSSNNRAGWALLHIDPKDWYIHMGTPTDRIGLKIGFGSILNIETGSYLMVGSQIPAAPGPPSEVAAILHETPQSLDYMKDLNTIGAGKGFAFGSSLRINTGDLTFLILYANYSAGMGFDLMLKDYGDAECKGRSGAIGINGWYANGQAYAYMHGELGVKVNLWFMKAKVPIITADFATLMQARLPNPSSFKAYLAVQTKVLGLINVNCRFKILIGDECELVLPGSSPLDMYMISDLSPSDHSNDISVFTAPQATFNMAIGKAFTVQDDKGEKTYRIQLKDFILNDGQNIVGQLEWNTGKDAASFYSHDVLPSQKDLTATVNVTFEEYKGGKWAPVYTSGKEAMETKQVSFKTNEAPDYIPLENVVYSYPVAGQKYFLKGESNKGYAQLRMGQPYLFPSGMESKLTIEDPSGQKQQVDFTYDSGKNRIEYTMPGTRNQTDYTLSILSFAKGTDTAGEAKTQSESLLNSEEEGNIAVESKQASAAIRSDIGKVLLTYDFSTGKYDTFSQKADAIQKGQAAVVKLSSDVLMFEYETQNMEPFDLAELTGLAQSENKPLISAQATLEDSYYKNKVYPLIYQDYPVQGTIHLKTRNADAYGAPPVKALPVMSTYLNQIEAGNFTGLVTKRFPYYYNLPAIYKSDFIDLQSQVINTYLNTPANPAYIRFVNGYFPFILPGYYKIKLQYVLPGGASGSSSTFDYYNFIN
jgi:hypothetical protein